MIGMTSVKTFAIGGVLSAKGSGESDRSSRWRRQPTVADAQLHVLRGGRAASSTDDGQSVARKHSEKPPPHRSEPATGSSDCDRRMRGHRAIRLPPSVLLFFVLVQRTRPPDARACLSRQDSFTPS